LAVDLVVVALSIGESFEEAPESVNRICMIRKTGAGVFCERHDIEHSAVERMPIPDQVVEHLSGSGNVRFDG